jgi:hypothetical protein
MPVPRCSLAAVLGAAMLLPSLPACSAPLRVATPATVAPVQTTSTEPAMSTGIALAAATAPDEPREDGWPRQADAGYPWAGLWGDLDLAVDDYRNYYSPRGLGGLALGIGLAAPLANTQADIAVRNWYQDKIRSSAANRAADVITYAGQLWLVLPVGLEAAAWMGHAADDYRTDGGLYEWSNRCLRSILVGVPPMVSLYVILGSSRPDRHDSAWHPFEDIHGVSGHTFMGALPFLTAAAMTDNNLLKGSLFLGSFLTGWARINNDRHYLSQVALGWWMACLSVTSVDETNWARRSWSIAPTWVSDGPGVAVQFRY